MGKKVEFEELPPEQQAQLVRAKNASIRAEKLYTEAKGEWRRVRVNVIQLVNQGVPQRTISRFFGRNERWIWEMKQGMHRTPHDR